ncbi:MAG TPA: DUF86 domain-containing protein [Candidatus Kapabacteria bacterium]|nr:DUF86 domain-containing protein [Candidatus Kapabacteria bacterium]
MSERGIFESLSDILEAIKRIRDYILDMDYNSFLDDMKTRDAVVRNLEIIGEASKNIKDDFRNQYPDVPWKEMAGVRDKLIHHYFGINFEVVWTIIHEELPAVQVNIDIILNTISLP